MKIATTKTIDGKKIKIQFTDDVARYVKQVAIIEQQGDLQKTYKINNIVYTFDDEI